MGRQWLQKKREVEGAKRGKMATKLVREITVAAKSGAPDPAMNPRLAMAIAAAHKQSISNETITRAIKRGAGLTGEKIDLELVTYEGFAPHQVPVIVECMTDNRNRTAPEIRVLFRAGQIGAKVGFLFDHVGIVEATRAPAGADLESAAIEAGAQDVEPLEEVAAGQSGGRFITDRADVDVVTKALQHAGWTVTVSELGYVAKQDVDLPPAQRTEVEAFLAALDDHDDVHRIYTALR